MSIEIIDDTAPVHLLGESHVLSYANLVARDSATGRIHVPNAKCLISLKASEYANVAAGALHPLLIEALQELSIAEKADRALKLASPRRATALALFAGDMDLHADLFAQMDQDCDVELPGQPFFANESRSQMIPFELLDLRLKEIFAPFFMAATQFQAVGIEGIVLHALPPRTPDAERARRWCEGRLVSASLRAKITFHANSVLAEFAAKQGLGFVSTWDALAPEGYILPKYDLDGVHVTREAAAISFRRIIEAGIINSRMAAA
jgi:hypothetical protein